jgi:hypothetical protein
MTKKSVHIQYRCNFISPNIFNPWLAESTDANYTQQYGAIQGGANSPLNLYKPIGKHSIIFRAILDCLHFKLSLNPLFKWDTPDDHIFDVNVS